MNASTTSGSYVGSHTLPDGTCCHCGPANIYSGPQWACKCNDRSHDHNAMVTA